MFEWDPAKSAANLAKHGIDFETAMSLWQDEDGVFGPTFSPEEERWMRVARLDGKFWSAVYTYRGDVIRLISVRRSRPGEIRQYGETD